jgi:deoxyribodipyrimidine photo-lyase
MLRRARRTRISKSSIVRRELSFNFTLRNPNYDSLASLPAWAQKTMREHIDDERQFT